MKNVNPSALDYKRQMQHLLNDVEKLKLVIITRLYTLSCQYPEAPIAIAACIDKTTIKAKSLIPIDRSKEYIKDLPFNTQITFIKNIEKYINDQNPHKQLNLFNEV